jgi:CRISPR/Cas system-associated exonuclease Cas4 (RecB family)
MQQKLSEQRGITGNHFFDYASCKTRLWLSNKKIDVGMDNEHIQIGKYIDEKTKPKLRKTFTIQGLCSIDYVEFNNLIEVHEIKKGKHPSRPHYLQLLFYLQVIYEITREEPIGYLHLPETRRKIKVIRNQELVYSTYDEILNIINGECPKPKVIPICVGCRFMEMCFS